MRWRLLLSPPLPGADNMALDEALMERARRTGETVLRVYAWERPTLSFGRNQAARGAYSAPRAAAHGVDVVRRPTGGRALLHHREVTYSVTAPVTAEPLRASYARINALLLDGLDRLGVAAALAVPAARAPAPGVAPCFETPTAGEVVVGGRKLVGSAQWRDGGALLQHGSILVEDDQTMLASLATLPLPDVPPPATLRAALGRVPAAGEVADALFAAARALEDPHAAPLALDAPQAGLDEIAAAARARYADDAWTWRR
jgi:lipoyl(octanoyl) transferase